MMSVAFTMLQLTRIVETVLKNLNFIFLKYIQMFIFIDALSALLHIFKQTTHQKLTSPKKHGYEYDQNRMFSLVINRTEIA